MHRGYTRGGVTLSALASIPSEADARMHSITTRKRVLLGLATLVLAVLTVGGAGLATANQAKQSAQADCTAECPKDCQPCPDCPRPSCPKRGD